MKVKFWKKKYLLMIYHRMHLKKAKDKVFIADFAIQQFFRFASVRNSCCKGKINPEYKDRLCLITY